MKLLHNVQISMFDKDTDREGLIVDALHRLVPLDWEKEKIVLEIGNAKGVDGDHIGTFKLILEKQRHLKSFIGNLKEGLGKEQVKKLNRQKLSRLDETLHFFIRLEKAALEKGKFKLTDSGDCYHIRMSVAAFPKSMMNGLRVIDDLFPEQL